MAKPEIMNKQHYLDLHDILSRQGNSYPSLLLEIGAAAGRIDNVLTGAIVSELHIPGDWRNLSEQDLHDKFVLHYLNYINGADDDDHLVGLICRALMLLQLRIERIANT